MKKKIKRKFYKYIHEKDLNEYEKSNKILSYKNLFYDNDKLILCNNIIKELEYLEQVNGAHEEEEYQEVFQYFIIEDSTARRLIDNTDEIVYYHNKLDIYILGVTHYGTSWDYVLTDFELKEMNNNGYYEVITCKK